MYYNFVQKSLYDNRDKNIKEFFQEAGSVAVLPQCREPLSLSLIPSPGAVCPFWFPNLLRRFSLGTPVFLLQLKLDFFSLFLLESSVCTLSKATLFKDVQFLSLFISILMFVFMLLTAMYTKMCV